MLDELPRSFINTAVLAVAGTIVAYVFDWFKRRRERRERWDRDRADAYAALIAAYSESKVVRTTNAEDPELVKKLLSSCNTAVLVATDKTRDAIDNLAVRALEYLGQPPNLVRDKSPEFVRFLAATDNELAGRALPRAARSSGTERVPGDGIPSS